MRRQPDVGGLVEARPHFDHHVDPLPVANGTDQVVDDPAARSRPVERHLDLPYPGVVSRLVQKPLHRRVKRLIWVVQQDRPLLADAVEDGTVGPKIGVLRGLVRRVFQIGSAQLVQLHQVPQTEEPFAREHVLALQAEHAREHPEASAVEVPVDLQPYDRCVHPVLADVVDHVAGDPEVLARQDLHVRKEQVQIVGHHALEWGEHHRLPDLDETRDARTHRHLHPSHAAVFVVRIAQRDQKVEREVGDERKGVCGVDGLRRHQWVDVAHIVPEESPSLTRRDILPVGHRVSLRPPAPPGVRVQSPAAVPPGSEQPGSTAGSARRECVRRSFSRCFRPRPAA